jgi:hypothetical protein
MTKKNIVRNATRWVGLAAAVFTAAPTFAIESLPLSGTEKHPVILLELGKNPAFATNANEHVLVSRGQIVDQHGVDSVAEADESVNLVHKGNADFGATLRFALTADPIEGPYTFWARWQQGGDPGYCSQDYKILAGADGDALEERGVLRMTNDYPWKYTWVNAQTAISLKSSDRVVQIVNAGRGSDAKMFDAFLLVPGTPPVPDATPKSGAITVQTSAAALALLPELPVIGSAEKPQTLLLPGAAPLPSTAIDNALFAVAGCTVSAHEGDRGVVVGDNDVQSLRAGTGPWSIALRFKLPEKHPEGVFTFWAYWRQGGDPNVSEQTFEVWAGADETKLESRGRSRLRPNGWTSTWRDGGKVTIKGDDRFVEIRNLGGGQTAKIFQAFLLGGTKPPPPPIEMPVAGTAESPVLALGFGKTPFDRLESSPTVSVSQGVLVDKPGADAGNANGSVATIVHKGLGEWGATFQFEIAENVKPGYYGFHVRYMCGGEVSQVRQTFTVKAGPDAASLGDRGTFQTVNKTPFQHQWISGSGTMALLPGDRIIQIANTGKAHDAKVFSGFALDLKDALPVWFSAEHAKRRSSFFSLARRVDPAQETLYVLDGEGPDDILFQGLSQGALSDFYATTHVAYMLGEAAEATAKQINLTERPAAVLVNSDRRILGVLSRPETTEQVVGFLEGRGKGGFMPPSPAISADPRPLKNGVPKSWLLATGWPGRCGVGHWGLDAEALQRPNPGDIFGYGFYTAGFRSGAWEVHAAGADGATTILGSLPESYAWGKSTSYAVAYLHADAPTTALLHFHHSGIQSAVFLEGRRQATAPDRAPPFILKSRAAATSEKVVDRPGQETHDDIGVPQSAEAPQVATLKIQKGWNCLVLKMVHAQDKGDQVLFAASLTNPDGVPIDRITSQPSDPTVDAGLAHIAAGLWPLLTLDNVPGNLPRPGEPLTLTADLRIPEQPRVPRTSFMKRYLPELFLPVEGTLRVRMTDYDGKEIKTVEAAGVFPGVVKLDLGAAPAPGYYSLIPELIGKDGRLIRRFHSDGFSVVLGNAAQKERVDRKKLMNSYYYAFNDWDTLAPWLERTGMLKNIGSTPGVSGNGIADKWADATERGIVLCADFAGDSNWMNNSDKDMRAVIDVAASHTRLFKSVNEIDGRWGGEEGVGWHAVRLKSRTARPY